MRVEQMLRSPSTNLSLAAARIERRIFIERTPSRPPEHIKIVEDNQPGSRPRRCDDEILHVPRHHLGPDPGAVRRIHAVINRGGPLRSFDAEGRIRRVAKNALDSWWNGRRGAPGDTHALAGHRQHAGERSSDLSGTKHHVQLRSHRLRARECLHRNGSGGFSATTRARRSASLFRSEHHTTNQDDAWREASPIPAEPPPRRRIASSPHESRSGTSTPRNRQDPRARSK